MPKLNEQNSAGASTKEKLIDSITLIDEQLRKKNFSFARDSILQALIKFPSHPLLLDKLFIVDQRWNEPIVSGRFHLTVPSESDFSFLQQCYANEVFMEQLLPMGRRS